MSDKDKNPVDTETAIEDKNGQNVEEENDRILLSKEVLQTDDDLSEMGSWMLETLRKQQPDAEITLSSVQVSFTAIQFSCVFSIFRVFSPPKNAGSYRHAGRNHNARARGSQENKSGRGGRRLDPHRRYVPHQSRHPQGLEKIVTR